MRGRPKHFYAIGFFGGFGGSWDCNGQEILSKLRTLATTQVT